MMKITMQNFLPEPTLVTPRLRGQIQMNRCFLPTCSRHRRSISAASRLIYQRPLRWRLSAERHVS